LRYLATIVGFTALAVCGKAQAQGVDEFGAYGEHEHRFQQASQQYGAFEMRFGRYLPRVDSSLSGGTPFASTFGNSNRYLVGLEVDLQVVRFPHLGTLGPGLGWGYTRANALAHLTYAPTVQSAESTSLTTMPFYLVGVFRADVLARDYGIPFVPYAKLGIGYALWWASEGGHASVADGVVGRGSSYGLQYALGGMFLLDWLDPQTARDADNGLGINHSYVFAEWYNSELNGFGSKSSLNVGADTWVLGIAIEF
jgi:hypothetical protein